MGFHLFGFIDVDRTSSGHVPRARNIIIDLPRNDDERRRDKGTDEVGCGANISLFFRWLYAEYNGIQQHENSISFHSREI